MDEKDLLALMQNGRLKMPFSDFEERTMVRIKKEVAVKNTAKKYRKLSWLFFIVGTVVGAIATNLVTNLPGIDSESFALACRLLYVILLLIAFNYLIKSTRKKSDKVLL